MPTAVWSRLNATSKQSSAGSLYVDLRQLVNTSDGNMSHLPVCWASSSVSLVRKPGCEGLLMQHPRKFAHAVRVLGYGVSSGLGQALCFL
jgi:hypothetical protein